jgi:MFS family permease
VRRVLRSRGFRALLGGQALATAGHQVAALALPTLAITRLHATTFEVGILAALSFLPSTLFGVFAGLAADRLPRRWLMVSADLGRAAVIGAVAVLTARSLVRLEDLYAAAALTGVLGLVFDVSYQSHVPDLVAPEDLATANAALEVNRSAGTVAGPAVSGGLIELAGVAGALFSAVGALVASIGVLSTGGGPAPPAQARRAHGSLTYDLREGVATVVRDRRLLYISLCTATSNLGAFAFWAVALVFAYRTLGMSPGQYGVIAAIGNIGLLGGAAAAAPLARRLGVGRTLFIAIGLFGLAMVVTPIAAMGLAAGVLAITQLVTNFALPVYGVNQVSLRQAITPRDLQGRMNAVMRTIALSTVPLGSLAGGALAVKVGPAVAMSAGGAVAALAPLWLLGLLSLKSVPAALEPAVPRAASQRPAAAPSTAPAMSLGRG